MVRQCHVCKNSKYWEPGLSLHRFPRDAVRRKEWFLLLGFPEDRVLPQSAEICMHHFTEDDFDIKYSGLRVLKDTALPLPFYPASDDVSQNISSDDSTVSVSTEASPRESPTEMIVENVLKSHKEPVREFSSSDTLTASETGGSSVGVRSLPGSSETELLMSQSPAVGKRKSPKEAFTKSLPKKRAQATEEVKQELAEFLETPITIKEEPLGEDPLDIAPSTSNQYCDTEDWLQVKLEPDDDQDMDIVGPKIEDPGAYESITNDIERSPELDRATDSRGPDPIDLMFLDFAERFKQFSASMQLVVRDKICQIFADAETDEIRSRKQ